MKKIIALLALCLLICACRGTEYCEIVTGKKYIPGHTDISTMVIGEVVIPTVRYEPDEWLLFTENHRKSVPEFIYEFAEIGDTVFVTKKRVHVQKSIENERRETEF